MTRQQKVGWTKDSRKFKSSTADNAKIGKSQQVPKGLLSWLRGRNSRISPTSSINKKNSSDNSGRNNGPRDH